MTDADGCEPGACRRGRLRLGGVLLAAGEGRRLGGQPKALIEVGGEALILRNLRVLREAGVDDLVVVTGHFQEQLAPLLENVDLSQVTQLGEDHTQSDSLRLGVAALNDGVDAVMVLPVDMPLLTRADLVALIGAYKHAAECIEFVGPIVGSRPGNPVLFSRKIAASIASGEGEFGSGAWRHQSPDWLLEWQTDNVHYVTDIDTPEDLARWTGQTDGGARSGQG